MEGRSAKKRRICNDETNECEVLIDVRPPKICFVFKPLITRMNRDIQFDSGVFDLHDFTSYGTIGPDVDHVFNERLPEKSGLCHLRVPGSWCIKCQPERGHHDLCEIRILQKIGHIGRGRPRYTINGVQYQFFD